MQLVETQRGNISEAAADAVRAMIVDGRLGPGDRINEVHLSRQLGVSRTPLREALSGLVAEGALIARPRLGYFVRPLTLEEFEQIYDIRPLLDPEAQVAGTTLGFAKTPAASTGSAATTDSTARGDQGKGETP
mgnify:CR=1 FL=1